MSFAEWRNAWNQFQAEHTSKTYEAFPQWLISMVDAFAAFVDVDGDGLISERDYELFFRAFDVSEDSGESFRRMSDRPLDKEALQRLVFEFQLSTVESSPGNWLFGQV